MKSMVLSYLLIFYISVSLSYFVYAFCEYMRMRLDRRRAYKEAEKRLNNWKPNWSDYGEA